MTRPAPFFDSSDVTIWHADARDAHRWLPEDTVDAIVTSPPYFGLRDYGVDGQMGLEDTPGSYIGGLADTLTSYVRTLKPDGSLWLNIGDSYNTYPANRGRTGSNLQGGDSHHARPSIPSGYGLTAKGWPAKCLLMIPERIALALIDRGWILRNKVVWHKTNGMPESVQDRCATKWEYVFHFVRRQSYYYDLDAIRVPQAESSIARASRGDWRTKPGRDDAYFGNPPAGLAEQENRDTNRGANPGDVWSIATQGYSDAHFAVFPEELIRRPILATVPEGGVALDPFFGSGTTGVMARRLGRRAWGIELNDDYCRMAADRFAQEVLPL